MTRRRYRQDKETGKLIEIIPQPKQHFHSVGVFEEVVAPDGTRIASRGQMQAFEHRTGLTNDMDSLREQSQNVLTRKRGTGTKKERIAALLDAHDRVQSSGFGRRAEYDD